MLVHVWLDWLDLYQVGIERHTQGVLFVSAGLVDELSVDGGTVEAFVRDQPPCRVVLHFLPVDSAQWDLFWSLLTPEAMKEFRKGAVNPVIRNAFAVADIHMLPERYKELKMTCTCPDWIKPCKHALAVLRVLGEEIEADPMLLVRLRGGGSREAMPEAPVELEAGEPLRTDGGSYWGEAKDWGEFEEQLLGGGAPARLLKRLGPVSVYGVRMEPDSMFKPVYEGVAAEAKVMLEGIRKKVKA